MGSGEKRRPAASERSGCSKWCRDRTHPADRASDAGVLPVQVPLIRSSKREQLVLWLASGTERATAGYPEGSFIDRAWDIGHCNDPQAQNSNVLEVVMPLLKESIHARSRLAAETPISDDANLQKLQEQAEQFVREAKRRCTTEADELISTVIDAVARDYFRHTLRKQQRAHK
jgi:hypothetical protein